MKYKLTQAEFDALEANAQKEYTLSGDSAVLKIEGEDAPTMERIEKLEAKRGIEAEHRKTAETKLKDSEDRAAKLQKDLEGAGGNKEEIEKLRTQHGIELEKLREERAAETAKTIADRNVSIVREEAEKFANGHFTIPSLITDQFAKRLSIEDVNGTPVVRVINPDGTPSTAALGDLQKEFLDNKELSTIIKGKAGSGGGATPHQSGGATTKTLSEMNATEEAAFEKEDPSGYAAAVEALEA